MTRAPDTVGAIMKANVVTVDAAGEVRATVRAMVEANIGSAVVTDDGRVVGLFTERDLLRRILGDEKLLDRSMREVMSAPAVCIGGDRPMIEAFDLMTSKGIRRLPVLQGEELVGIVTERDLLKWVSAVGQE